MKSFLQMIALAILLIAAPAKTLAIDTSFNEPGFRLNTDIRTWDDGTTNIMTSLDTIHGILDHLSVSYSPMWIQDKDGNWSESSTEGWVNINFFGFLTPPVEEMKTQSQSLSVKKLGGFSVFESVYWEVYDGDGGLWTSAFGHFSGSFKLRGDAKTSYNEHLFDNMPTGFSVDVRAPIIWTEGSVPKGLKSVSIPEPASLALLSLGLISAFRRIRPK